MKSVCVALVVCIFLTQINAALAFEVVADPAAGSPGNPCPVWGSTRMEVTGENFLSGEVSCVNTIQEGGTGFGRWGGIITLPEKLYRGDEIWMRTTVFFPEGFNYDSTSEGNRLKFLRLRTAAGDGTHRGYNDLYINPEGSSSPLSFIYEGERKWAHFSSPENAIVRGEWEVYEMYIRLDNVASDAGGMAHVRIWKNGILIANLESRMTLADADGYAHAFYLFTYWNGGAPQTQSMYIDEFKMTTHRPASLDQEGFPYLGLNGLDGALRPTPPGLVNVE